MYILFISLGWDFQLKEFDLDLCSRFRLPVMKSLPPDGSREDGAVRYAKAAAPQKVLSPRQIIPDNLPEKGFSNA